MLSKYTTTEIAKTVVHMVVALNVKAVVSTQMEERTELNDDSVIINAVSYATGHLVANQTDRITEPMIERIADRWQARKVAKKIAAAVVE